MAHSPEDDAARYLAGDFRGRALAAFERHLLSCEDCWHEVGQGRKGRAVAAIAREAAPSELRERIRATIAAAPEPVVGKSRRLTLIPVLALSAAAVAVVGVIALPGAHSGEPSVIHAALADYSADRLPGTEMVHEAVPDLSRLGFSTVGTGEGKLGSMAVNAFAYRNSAGQRLFIYTAAGEFPRAAGASSLTDGPWIAHSSAMSMLCARVGHSMLIVGEDDALLEDVGQSLRAM